VQLAFASRQSSDTGSVVRTSLVRYSRWEATYRIRDKYARADQTNSDRRDQRWDCTGTNTSAGALAQASGGARVEHAGKNEVGALLAPPLPIASELTG
jgi:hypothetical protein